MSAADWLSVANKVDSLLSPTPKVDKAEKVTHHVPTLVERVAPGVPIPSDPATLIRINGGVQVGAGLLLATGRMPRIASLALAASLLPTTYAGHAFWQESEKAARAGQRTQFFKNVSMMGGLLLAGVDTEGKPGLAWRARRAARDVRRETRQLARQARTEARVAKAHLS